MFKNRIFLALLSLLAIVGTIAIAMHLWYGNAPSAKKITNRLNSSSPVATSPPIAPPSQINETIPPSFDVVRVTPNGNAVIAGRATPNSRVVINDNGQFLGQLDVNANGEWVFVPEKPFTPGSRQLSLQMRIDGQKTVTSDDVVVLVVPEPKKDISGRKLNKSLQNKSSQSLALKFSKKDRASSVLQRPAGNIGIGSLSVDTVDYNETGQLIISGRATPETSVIVYLNNLVAGKSGVSKSGAWQMRPDNPVKPGLYTLRADQIAPSGKVLSRMSMPFSRAEPINKIPSEPFIIVQPGNSLWRIARKTMGSGFGFTIIYEANKEHIKDPDLIFPGQVFVLPSDTN